MKQYREMTNEAMIAYVKEVKLFPEDHPLTSEEIGDGNLNYVFRVRDTVTGKSMIVKQALPYLKIAGAGWKLTLDRNRIEAEAMKLQNEVCPGLVPQIYHHDDALALTAMEDLGNMEVLRKGLMSMKKYPKFPAQAGRFMARNLFLTSDLGMGAQVKKQTAAKFSNPELCDITEKLVLSDPYMDAPSNEINPEIMDDVKALWARKEIRLETAKLKQLFMTKAEALLHGDLHTGSIFIDQEKAVIFDTEFAFYGPYSYDIGLLYANIALNYVSWEGRRDKTAREIADYRAYLIEFSAAIWEEFRKELTDLWHNQSKDSMTTAEGYEAHYVRELLREAAGFCACEIMRRIIGMAHVPDLDEIEDLKQRAKAQRLGLKIARNLLLGRREISAFSQFAEQIEKETK